MHHIHNLAIRSTTVLYLVVPCGDNTRQEFLLSFLVTFDSVF